MGAGAFIMAEWLDIPYAHIAAAAVIPALLYFSAIFFSVDALARLHGLKPIARAHLPRVSEVFHPARALPTFGSMLAIVALLFQGYTPTVAGAAATILLIMLVLVARIITVFLSDTGETLPEMLARTAREIVNGLIDAGRNVVTIAVLLACAGIVVAVLSASGVAVKFSALMVSLADVDLFVLLLLTALLCIMLGMDVPTTASYILASSVVAGSLGALGLKPLTAHMFIFYFAILSAITPPVCASVYAAATIAKENFWRVAKEALRIGGAAYFIPFMFVYRPSLMLDGPWYMIAYDLTISMIAIYALTAGLLGYCLGRASAVIRVVLIALAFLLFYPETWADVVGVIGVSAIALYQFLMTQKLAALRALTSKNS
jgi:TRAP transporter 4TM/12TM fusion protein